MQQTNINLNNGIQEKNKNWTFAIYVALTMAIYILPLAKMVVPYIIAGTLMMVSAFVVMFNDKNRGILSFYLIAFSVVILAMNFINGMALIDAINDLIRNIRFFLPALWALYAINNVGTKQKKFIFWSFMLVSVFILIKTLTALEKEPWIARILAQDQSTSTDSVNKYRRDNVGGYAFSYMIGAVALMSTWAIFNSNKKYVKVFCIIFTILCFYYIIQTMYTTLLILTSIGITLIILIRVKSPIIKFFIILMVIVAVFYLPQIIKYVGSLFSKESLLNTKFEQIYESLTGGGIEALGSRPKLMGEAFENWLKSPIFGDYYNTPTHSTILEYMQQNGLFGLALWLVMFFEIWKIVLNELKKANINTTLFNVVYLYVAVLAFFNDIRYTFEITITVFFISVIFSLLFCSKKNEEGLSDDK